VSATRKTAPSQGWTAVAVTLVLAAGCKQAAGQVSDAQAAPAPGSPTASAAPVQLTIGADLLRDGRIQSKPAERAALSDQVFASGEVVPAVEGEARAGVLVPGRVASILVKEGDRVKAGQALAWIDAPEAAKMQGDWLRASSRLWRAQKVAEQERALWAEKATSERALHAAEAELREASADARAAWNLLVSSRVPVPRQGATGGSARIAVSAPIAGIVSKRNAVVGGHVTSEASLFEIVDPDKLLVRAGVPEVVARRVEIGASALIRARGADPTCPGSVQSKLERIDELKRTMGVLVKVGPGCPGLVAGAFADVTVRLSASGAVASVVVPRGAIVDVEGAPALFVERAPFGEGKYEMRLVRPGISDGVSTAVEDGVQAGERVVVVGALLLKGERMRRELGAE
jgi:cobalt-zinc-cadmium efflux system membrane fusion protein